MQHARPIGLALSEPLLERLDAIARAERVSRSSVARMFLVSGLAEYELKSRAKDLIKGGGTAVRPWRPRGGAANDSAPCASNDRCE
jgi:metal-responsive CopG/Arc/MetJ family transcriptional regulator